MKPLWLSERSLPTFDEPELAADYDVAVVGAGLTGLITALFLHARGHRVVVLEARTIGAGTSGSTTAKVSVLQGSRLSQIAAKHPDERVRKYVAGNQFGLRWLLQFCAEHDVAVQRPDALTYAPGAEELPHAEQEHELALRLGLPVSWHDTADVPFPFAGGTVLGQQAQLDPVELLTALALAAHRAGITVATGHRVLDVGTGAGADLITSRGPIAAARVVLATGIPIADRGGFFARLVPERSYLTAVHDPGAEQMDMYLSVGSPTRSVRTAPAEQGQWVLVGGNGHEVGRAESEAAQVQDLKRWTHQHFGGKVSHSWSAQDYHPVDELPYAGPLLPGGHRVLMASGYAKWGLANAPAAAAVLAGHLGAATPDFAQAYASWSTHELAGAGAASVHNLRVMGTLAADRVAALSEDAGAPAEGAGCVHRQGMQAVGTATVDGTTHTVSASCPHLGGLVRWNDAEQSWDCPLHGSRFTAAGDLIEGPATRGLSEA